MQTTFKVFIEFVTILLLFYVLALWPRGTGDLSSATRDRTRTALIERRSRNHWTAREVPLPVLLTGLRYVPTGLLSFKTLPGTLMWDFWGQDPS